MTVYDKAKYHFDSVQKEKLPSIAAYIHTGFYFGWIVEQKLLSTEFLEDWSQSIEDFLAHKINAPQLLEAFDGVLDDEMLSEEGNEFSATYFDFEHGAYLADYRKFLVKDLPTEFHVANTRDNYEIAKQFISARYEAWKKVRAKD